MSIQRGKMAEEQLSPTTSRVDLNNLAKTKDKDGNIVDLTNLTPQELKLFKMYGKLPSKKDLLKHKMQERKYFDSGDYALRQAGVIKNNDVISNSNNNLPVTDPSRLRESIIRRRLSNSSPNNSNSDNNSIERKGSISSGPPLSKSKSPIR
ncbi:phosphatase regulator NDAI_0B04500 [Naumovozyma dairenensis CBS 421]|uniref:mRNA stability protein n=1 Tax=Naumovozyma dairenensis (strain ATCC 10597 / BCRC 20456 / CBS 421 / NBRC 0211 / NRRL Y-12639) TaxID=1071378 RepID=G0W6S4_NAUDC|nr:hypothetical protein NDAI_0B04500 [Naumovozyma dairenensis CBS 421]CCD23485.1 hypothetical protein NDAI_0B04500 [Naumovozyma dairenensis CBS 421]